MFELNEEKLNESKVELKAKRMLADMMAEALLESDAPESVKLGIRVLQQTRRINEALTEDIVKKYVSSGKQANVETLKYVYEYLQLVEVGIKQFAQTTPYVANTEEEEDENIF